MNERTTELLGQLESAAKDLIRTIAALRAESQNEADEDTFLGVLELDKRRVEDAWQNLMEHYRPIPENPPRGPFDPPEN